MAALIDESVDPWLGALARLTDTGVLVVNPDNSLEYASEMAKALFGCPSPRNLDQCINPVRGKLEDAIVTLKHEIANGADPLLISKKFQADIEIDDKQHQLQLDVHLIDIDTCKGALVLVHDATEKQSLEDDLRLASRFRNVGRLYQSMAHDLRTPVAAVRLYSRLMRNMIDQDARGDEKAEKKLECIEVIEEAVTTLDNSLNMLLEELVPQRQHESVFNVRDVLVSATRLINPQATKNNIGLNLKVPDGEIKVTGSPDALKHAILNLCVNAIEAMPDGGTLLIDLHEEKDKVHIRITDTGTGVPKEIQDRIFKRHYTTKATGTGIGLHVARETIERLGGSIHFTSVEGQGSEFHIVLPLSSSLITPDP